MSDPSTPIIRTVSWWIERDGQKVREITDSREASKAILDLKPGEFMYRRDYIPSIMLVAWCDDSGTKHHR